MSATGDDATGSNSMRITGYADRWSAHPGQSLTFFVSCHGPDYEVELLRLIHGDDAAGGPGVKEEVVPYNLNGQTLAGRVQAIAKGSCVLLPELPLFDDMLITGAFRATRTSVDGDQTIVAFDMGGSTLCLKLRSGQLLVEDIGPDGATVRGTGERRVAQDIWYRFAVRLDRFARTFRVDFRRQAPFPFNSPADHFLGTFDKSSGPPGALAATFAAAGATKAGRQWRVAEPFNGRLANLALYGAPGPASEAFSAWQEDRLGIVMPAAAWDFVSGCATETVPDVVGGWNGRTINRPVRLVTGPDFAGDTVNPFEAPEQFNAAHFHDDDLSDAGWEPSFEYEIPTGLRSGVYAFRLRCAGGEDYIPFVVTPEPGKEAEKVAVLLPTFSYQVYANAQMDISVLPHDILPLADRDSALTPEEVYVRENGLLSCYDVHSDGSGVCLATNQRPMPIFIRPRSRNRLNGGVHQLGGDLHLIDWLEQKGIEYEIITDHELHFHGSARLTPYRAVISGSHAEYWSAAMLDALAAYKDGGGRFVYLSGNGLYWVAEPDADGSVIEIRRDQGLRTWDSGPGEAYISLSGTRGGTWRHHGKAPQKYVGVGQSAMGLGDGRPYRRTEASFKSRAAFLFDGIDDELIGDFPGLVNGFGAAGMEIDRASAELGTPAHALILGTASGFSDAYQLDIQDIGASTPYFGGTTHPDVRADIVFFETPKGGAVFAVGSIAWCAALSYNGYDNNVSRLTENVIRSFMADGDLPAAPISSANDCFA